MPGMVSTAEAVGVDLYEPICLPGSPTHLSCHHPTHHLSFGLCEGANDVNIKCKRPYLFEKVLNTALNVPEHFRVLNGLTPEDCSPLPTSPD